MRIFFKNYKNDTLLRFNQALEANEWQALEIFDNLPPDDDSYIGFINEDNQTLKILKHNKFVWLIDVPSPTAKGSYQGFFTRQRCRIIIQDLFHDLKFSDIPGLEFKKYF